MATILGDVQYSQVMGQLPTPVIASKNLRSETAISLSPSMLVGISLGDNPVRETTGRMEAETTEVF